MILKESRLKVIDNSGVKLVKCIKIVGLGVKRCGYVGNLLLITILKQNYNTKVNKKNIYYGLVVSVKQFVTRKEGTVVKFDSNRVILFLKSFKMVGTRVHGPVMKEVKLNILKNKNEKQKYLKVLSQVKAFV